MATLYGSYSKYLDKALDEVLKKEIKALNKELDAAIQQ